MLRFRIRETDAPVLLRSLYRALRNQSVFRDALSPLPKLFQRALECPKNPETGFDNARASYMISGKECVMTLDYSEYNQLLAERYEALMEGGERVVLEYDFVPFHQFAVTMGRVMLEMQRCFEVSQEAVKREMVSSVASFWVKEADCIIIRFFLWGSKLFVELPRSHFLWPHEADALLQRKELASSRIQ
jgi:hypothetical protein